MRERHLEEARLNWAMRGESRGESESRREAEKRESKWTKRGAGDGENQDQRTKKERTKRAGHRNDMII